MTKEEYDALPPYEKKSVGIYNEMKSDDDLSDPNVINFFCPKTPDWNTFPKKWVDGYKEHKPDKEVTGTVKIIPETHFDRKFETLKAIALLEDKLFTTKRTGGKRQTLRKKMEDIAPYEQYDYAALMMYLRQCYQEKSKYCLLSRKELAMILPNKR